MNSICQFQLHASSRSRSVVQSRTTSPSSMKKCSASRPGQDPDQMARRPVGDSKDTVDGAANGWDASEDMGEPARAPMPKKAGMRVF